jgi:predicted MFS family arabinose efflux permease
VPSPLKSSRLRRILVAYTVNRLGTWFGLVALSLAVFDHTHSALAVAALLMAWQALPAFIVPAVVARVEASQRGRELSGLYFFEAVTTVALAILLWHFWLPAVLLLAAIDGTAALAASALLRAEVARTAREEVKAALGSTTGADGRIGAERSAAGDTSVEDASHEAERKANAALNVAFSITFVLGPALAGAVVAVAGASTALFIDAGSFLVCGMLLIDLRSHIEEAGDDSVRARLRAAWRHVNETPSLRALLLVEAVALVFSQAVGPVEVTYAKTTLHAGDRGYGILLTAWGAGVVLGSLVFARSLRQPLGVMLGGGTLAAGLAYVGFAAAPSLFLACLAALIGGIGNGLETPSLISIVQRITPKHLHGRMMGAVESLIAVCIAIGLPLGGVLVALSSPRGAFLVLGLVTAATSVALFRVSPRGLAPAVADEAPIPVVGSDLPTAESDTAQTGVP